MHAVYFTLLLVALHFPNRLVRHGIAVAGSGTEVATRIPAKTPKPGRRNPVGFW